MRTQPKEISKNLLIALSTVMLLFATFNGSAAESSGFAEGEQVIYRSHSANHAIHGYPSSIKGDVALEPQLIYVSQAYGPAIHSYKHSGREVVAPWNVEYVDTAYGRAIYSYEGVGAKRTVKLLPIRIY